MDIEMLRNHIDYAPETGVFKSKTRRGNLKIGDVIGTANNLGYLSFQLRKERIYCHVAAFMISFGRNPNGYIDHINRDPADNRISNLRECSVTQNNWNAKKPKRDLPVGVYKRGNRFESLIRNGCKQIYLGRFHSSQEAENAYIEASKKFHGEFSLFSQPLT